MGALRNGEKLGKHLLELKEELEEKKAERAELQGEMKSLMKQLEEFGISTIEQAQSHIEKEEALLIEMKESIERQLQSIEEMMEDE